MRKCPGGTHPTEKRSLSSDIEHRHDSLKHHVVNLWRPTIVHISTQRNRDAAPFAVTGCNDTRYCVF
jgi:hypothetical protein